MASLPFKLKGKTLYIAGHRVWLGALVRRLAAENVELLTRQRSEIDLRGQAAVDQWLAARPARHLSSCRQGGGIAANAPSSSN